MRKYSVIHRLRLRNISPKYEKYAISSEKSELSCRLDQLHFEIAENLDGELFDKFMEYERTYGRYSAIMEEEGFKKGLSLAIRSINRSVVKK